MGAIWPLDRHITIGITSRPLDQHGRDLGRQITLYERGEISPKNRRFIYDISSIFCRYFATRGDFFKKISYISPQANISPIFWRYLRKYLPSDFFPRNIVSSLPNTRYITDISRHFPPWFLLAGDWTPWSQFNKLWRRNRKISLMCCCKRKGIEHPKFGAIKLNKDHIKAILMVSRKQSP